MGALQIYIDDDADDDDDNDDDDDDNDDDDDDDDDDDSLPGSKIGRYPQGMTRLSFLCG